jgi:hypothetical protein
MGNEEKTAVLGATVELSRVILLLHPNAVLQQRRLSTVLCCVACIRTSAPTVVESDSRSRGVPVRSVPRESLLRGVRVSGVDQLFSVHVSGVQQLPRVSGVRVSSLQLRDVRVSGVQQLRGVRLRSALALPESRLHQSPREVLRATMHELRRAAEAKRFLRIAGRLAGLAKGRTERVTWSSRKSLRGVC